MYPKTHNLPQPTTHNILFVPACQLGPIRDIISYIMRTYELMLVLKVDSAHDDEKKQKALVDKLMTEQVYSNVSITDMGKKQLAYEIQKLKEGRYVLVTFEAETVNAARLEQQIKLTDDVLRHLLTRTK